MNFDMGMFLRKMLWNQMILRLDEGSSVPAMVLVDVPCQKRHYILTG